MTARPKAPRPMKVGILEVVTVEGKRRVATRRFCILNANKELEYFSKDEYDPTARVGSIGGLDVCDIAIVDGSETDFVVTNAEASWVLRAMDDQDRRNWVLEIIKQRPIRSIIEMLRDDKIGSYAAYALANQCGGADELKLEIVRSKGLEPLLKFTSSEDQGLVGLIFYSMSKLSLMDENKAELGQHVPQLLELLRNRSTVAEFKAHALKTLFNLVTVPALRDQMVKEGGVRLMVRSLESVHASVQPEAASLMLQMVSSGGEPARAELLDEERAICTWIDAWHGLTEKDERQRKFSAALAHTIHALTVCCASRLPEGRKFLRSVCGRALPSVKPDVELRVVEFASLFRDEPTLPAELFEHVEPLTSAAFQSADLRTAKAGVQLFARLLADPSLADRATLWPRVNPVALVNLLADASPAIRVASASLFALVATKPGAAAGLQKDASVFTKLGDALLADAAMSKMLTASLASLSTLDEIKYALVTGSLRQGLISSLSTAREDAQVTEQVLAVFANCTTNAGARRALAEASVLRRLIETLHNPSQDVQTRVGSVLANLSANAHIRSELRAMEACEPLFGSIMATKNRHLRLALLGAVCNICYTADGDGIPLNDERLTYLVSVLGSKSVKLRVAAVSMLRNACLHMSNRAALVRCRGVPALMAFLASAKVDVQPSILTIVAACVEADPQAASADDVRAFAQVFGSGAPSRPVARAALRCLAAAAVAEPHRAIIVADGTLAALLSKCNSVDYVCAERAATAVLRCVGVPGGPVAPAIVRHLLTLCSSTHPVVLRCVLQTFERNEAARALLTPAERAHFALLLDFPLAPVRQAAATIVSGGGGQASATLPVAQALTLLAAFAAPGQLQGGDWTFTALPDGAVSVAASSLPRVQLASEGDVAVFFARLACSPTAPRLTLTATPFDARAAAAASSSPAVAVGRVERQLEHMQALAEYAKLLSALAQLHAEALDAVIQDHFLAAALHVEVTPHSSAQRQWGAHSTLLSVHAHMVAYTAKHRGGPGAVVAAGAAPHLGEFAYFEVLIVSTGDEGGAVALGMSDLSRFGDHRMPGWGDVGTCAYHSDDGNAYHNGVNREFGPAFGAGDVVGCGVDEIKGELFFTLNGRFLGVAATGINHYTVRPSVGLMSTGAAVFTNFGATPFLWDFSFDVQPFTAAPRSQPGAVAVAPVAQHGTVDVNAFAGGSWAREFAALYSRLCFLDAAVDQALMQTRVHFAKVFPATDSGVERVNVARRNSDVPLDLRDAK